MYQPKPIITREQAKDLFNILMQELNAAENLNERTILIVDNMALLEQLKHAHLDDIKQRGVVEYFVNGSQEMWRENKSVGNVLKIIEQQRKLQAELKLTPASDKRVMEVVAVDEFEKF